MKRSGRALKLLLGTVFLLSGEAFADPSCSALIAEKINYLQQHTGWFYAQMSIHRDDFDWGVHSSQNATVSYDAASGNLVAAWNFPLLFGIRYAGPQPFDINQPDLETWDISPSGLVHLRNLTWGFDSYYDMSCTDSVMTKYFPGFGVVTITFGVWGTIF